MRRVPQLDGLRGIAILMVFLFHAFGTHLLWAGVDLFFVLSGYLITRILLHLKEQALAAGAPFRTAYWRAFYFRRARRILPPYILFLLIVGLFFPIHWSHVWYWYVFFGANIEVAITGLAFLPIVPLWSLAVEEQFYLIWPCVLRVLSNRAVKRIALGMIVGEPVLRAVFTPLFHSYWPIYTLPLFRTDTLAWGAWIAVSEYETPSWPALHRNLAGLSAVIASGILGGLSAFSFFRRGANLIPFNVWGYSLIGIICGGVIVYALGSEDGFLHRLLAAPGLRYLGRISYTFYLYHLGVLLLAHHDIPSPVLSAVVAFLITLAFASISWIALESPILSWSPKNRPAPVQTKIRAAGSGS
ncbi:MAG TPA: acyltransferase [Bryobacteraceae bacterium]|nr:acyltransferase [Bryobacteraceae bacterium]